MSVGFYGKVKMHDSVPHAAERLLEISGSAAQVAVAQKLVADYLVTEQQQGQAEQQQQQQQQAQQQGMYGEQQQQGMYGEQQQQQQQQGMQMY